MRPPVLSLEKVSFARGRTPIISGIDLSIQAGEMVGLLGPNGCGKTTALRLMVGLLKPGQGRATAGGVPVTSLKPRERARAVGYLPQARTIVWRLAVEDAVGLGRFAYGAASGRYSGADRKAVDRVLELCGLTDLRRRPVTDLSGGELSRVHVARALVGGAPALAADEPVTSLDPFHQLMVLDVLSQLAAERRGLVVVLHDIALAARYCSRLVLMRQGRILADGPAREVLTPVRLREVFDIDAVVRWEGPVPSLTTKGRAKSLLREKLGR